jgi:SNF2 family DNA or RNA helicase
MPDRSFVLHANWSRGALHLWGEDARAVAPSPPTPDPAPSPIPHPFAAGQDALRSLVGEGEAGTLTLLLPCDGATPLPSPQLESRMGGATDATPDVDFEDPTVAEAAGPAVAVAGARRVALREVTVPTLCVPADRALAVLESMEDHADEAAAVFTIGASLEYFALASELARWVLAQQRFVPSLVQLVSGDVRGSWQPWLSDQATAERVALLVHAMPASARAGVDALKHDAWSITSDFVSALTDAACRATLAADDFPATIAGRDPLTDSHVAWLTGLLGEDAEVHAGLAQRQDLARRVRAWIATLEERGASSQWRLLFRLGEPDVLGMAKDAAPPPEETAWALSFHLQALDTPSTIVDAADIWLMHTDQVSVLGRRIDQPQDLLLKELGRASRMYRKLEQALSQAEPSTLALNTRHAYEFLREVRPVLLEQGFGVEAPAWWDTPTARLGAKLRIESQDQDAMKLSGASPGGAAKPQMGLASLVNYTWEISVGDATLTLAEFEQLAAKRVPLVRVNGRWVEIRPEDVHAAIKFIKENPGGAIRLSEAMRMAYASDLKTTGIPVVGLEAQGWLAGFMNSEAAAKQLEMLPPPRDFQGTLRPYQARGVSWMMFQERLGFGICLADDMGLGKTVQLLALLAYEREGEVETGNVERGSDDPFVSLSPRRSVTESQRESTTVPPTLLLVPMSVVGNWVHETKRFCPHLKVLVHHGTDRSQGDKFIEHASEADLVITTYSLAHRDRDLLAKVKWGRVVLDEAQYIKNAQSKQSQAVRMFDASHRVALTGTPVENRLQELWSIMDFLNPGYLGGPNAFRSRFALPIERYHDRHKGDQLRGLIRPFVLRRLKTDPTVVSDLPAKLESREFSHLTAEQAALYESCVKRTLAEVDAAEGIQRRGLVLSSLIKLKQVCNHPAQALKEIDASPVKAADPARSGKCTRLLEMLDEAIAEGDQSLVFTQFRQMGRLLEVMIRQRFGREVLFIHGGVPQSQRTLMVEQFQRADGTYPVLLLSLRAGGVGLNLTAATHVFHFDRWWNPAVENQATDRAYRIGQTRTVQVHKFVVRGTLEERIDQMIESKTELAENIIGQGEQWLTDLSTEQLRDILTLRNDAIDDLD